VINDHRADPARDDEYPAPLAAGLSCGDPVCSEAPVPFYIIMPQAHADRMAFLVRVFTR